MYSTEIAVIIVNWNTKEMLRNCLASIKDSGEFPLQSIVVVDNASKDGSREMLAELYPEIHLINTGRNAGFAAANNIALQQCNSQYILFLNPDTFVFPNSITNLVNLLANDPSVGAVGCKMKDEFGKIQPLGLQWFPSPITEFIGLLFVSNETMKYYKKILPYRDPEKSGYVKKIYGACFLVRKVVLDKVGYFDDRFFMYVEDVDLCRRIKDAGWNIYYLSESEIIHYCGASSNKACNYFSTLMKCESIGKYMEKYYGKIGMGLYKIFVFTGSNLRVIFLAVFKLLTLFFNIKYKVNLNNSIKKYIKMIRWSINIEKAIIKD